MELKKLICSSLIVLSTSLGSINTAHAGPDPFLGEIQWFAGNFAPRGWMLCDGQLLPISQYSALFSILGVTYGGDGRTTFALPDVRGRVMIHAGRGPGLSDRRQGSRGGTEQETLTAQQLPSHTHTLNASSGRGDSAVPSDKVLASPGRTRMYSSSADAAMNSAAIGNTGGGQAHNNMQPYVTLNCIIAVVGTYPSRD